MPLKGRREKSSNYSQEKVAASIILKNLYFDLRKLSRGQKKYFYKFHSSSNVKLRSRLCFTKYIHIYLEYHRVCPLVRIGTPHPISRKRVCHLPRNRGGEAHSPKGEGLGGPSSGDYRKVLALCLLCGVLQSGGYKEMSSIFADQ